MKFIETWVLQSVFVLLSAFSFVPANAAKSAKLELPHSLHQKIVTLSKNGDLLASKGKYTEAVQTYEKALALVPKPFTDWEASTWLLVAIGDAHFLAKDYPAAKRALADAMHCPKAIGNPFIHMRLGQTQFELGDMQRAADELARAYIQEGKSIFRDEDVKYIRFIKSKLKPPPGGWPVGW